MGTVLVAEDSRTIRTVCEWVFKGSEFDVVTVEDGAEALQAAQAQNPDVIVLDYTLPDQDAYELCKTLKSDPQTANVPVLMLGGSFAEFDEDRATACGADDSILKPFRADDLLNKVIELQQLGASGGTRAPAGSPAAAAPAAAGPATADEPEQKSRFQFPSRGASPPPRRFTFPSGGQQQPGSGAATPAGPTEATPAPSTPPTGTAQPAAAQPAPVAAAAAGAVVDDAVVREEIQKAVKEMLPTIVRSVLKELITKEVTPQLQRWVEGKVETLVTRLMQQR